MIEAVRDTAPETLARYSAIIDVRSPAEFADDHLPDAINLPVLSNEERAGVGTIYVQESRFQARRIGAAYVARNVAHHLETALSAKDAKFRPLIYCWRGGMRSNAMATILSQIGWRVGVLDGGYKTWRRSVTASLFSTDEPLKLVLIDGETGSAKTAIITRLSAYGVQTIDLEGVAAHRGSVFGADPAREQPTQKHFESILFDRLRRLDLSAPIAIEAESSKIGRLSVPKRIWSAMSEAPRIHVSADDRLRSDYLLRAYADLIENPDRVRDAVERLRPFHAREVIDEWLSLIDAYAYPELAARLTQDHYDPLYRRSRKRENRPLLGVIAVHDLSPGAIDSAAAEIADIIRERLS